MPSSRPSNVLNDSKKGYTLKEKSDILQYIVKQNAYSEVRGRSFWLKMEKSKITVRTWQSLKEVFLKRILPDLRNPYYKLTHEQIRAFSSRSAIVPKATKAMNWVEKNKAMDKVLNRSMSEQNEDSSQSNAKRKKDSENKQDTKKHSPTKNISPDTSNDSDFEILSFADRTANSQPSTSNENDVSQQNNSRITRNKDKENNVNTGSSQDSQPIESFPTSALLTSTPRKSLLRSSNLNSAQKNVASKSIPSPPKINVEVKPKSPVKETSTSVRVNNSARDGNLDSPKTESIKKSLHSSADNRAFSPNILLLSSSDSSLSDDSASAFKPQNKSKRNLFGFSSGKPTVSASQAMRVSSETDISSEVVINGPSTSNFNISPSRQNKLVNRQKSFIQGDSSDSDDEDGTSSDSQYTYYKNSDTESLKRKGKKMYGLFRGKLVPLYEPKKKCCIERRELIAKGKIVKKRKGHKGKGAVYLDNDFENGYSQKPKNALNGRLNDKGDNMLSKEILNFWKLKYLSLKRRNDEIMRLLAKQKNETYIDSVTKMLTDPVGIPDKLQRGGTGNNNHLPSLLQGDEDVLPPGQLAQSKRRPNPDTGKQIGKKFVITSSKSHNEPTTSKGVAESDNVVVIDSQKADIIIDILKKVSEMNRPIDPIKVNRLISSPKTKSLMASKQSKPDTPRPSPSRTRMLKTKQTDKNINTSVDDKNTKSKEVVPDEILKLREKERQIFEKISLEKTTQESNTERDLFSKSELELLFNEMENNMSNGDKNTKKREKDSSDDNKEPNNPSKKLRSNNNNKTEPEKPSQADAGTSKNNKNNKNPADNVKPGKSNSQTPKKSQPPTKESLTQDTSNTLPESMDITDDVKFAINPKFFSILFPNKTNDNEASNKKSVGEVIPSSDNEFDESARYSLPKSSSFNVKKNKNRRSTGKVIKLKMFTNLKKTKRQSFCEDVDSVPNNEGSLWLVNNNLQKNTDSSTSSSSEEGSVEIPLQGFKINSNNRQLLENNLCINNLCQGDGYVTQSTSQIDLNKPLLEQPLESMSVEDDCRKTACQYCDFSQQYVPEALMPETFESVPLLDLTLGRLPEVDTNVQQLHDEPQKSLEIENSPDNQSNFVSCDAHSPTKPQEICENNNFEKEENHNVGSLINLEPTHTESISSLDVTNFSICNTITQSDTSDVELNISEDEIIVELKDKNDREKQMIKDLMSEEDSD